MSREVRDIILERRAQMSRPKARKDPHHVALVVEGGGMRGVTAGGMVSALEDAGFRNCFDSVHGSSAGAAAGAYFVSGQANLGTSLYYEDLNDSRFINPVRFLYGKPILDAEFLVEDAMRNLKPLSFDALIQSSIDLHIVSTDIDRGESYTVSTFRDYEHYRSLLKASISLPLIAGRSRLVDGRRLLDGGLLQQIAIRSAEAAGATHILALLTRVDDELQRPPPGRWTKLEAFALQKMYGGCVGRLYVERSGTINEQIAQALSGRSKSGAAIEFISLPESLRGIERLTKDASVLKAAAEISKAHTEMYMSQVPTV